MTSDNPSPAAAGARLNPGDRIETLRLTDVLGLPLTTPDPGGMVHLQFRRFAGCPVCDLHLRSIARRHAEIEAAGIREVVVFHSSREHLTPYVADLPFQVVPDPRKGLYVAFGVEAAPRALTSPAAWGPIARAILHAVADTLFRGRPAPPLKPQGGRLGLPADFLVAPDGRLIACKYGDHAHDQWSVDEVIALGHQARAAG